MTESAGPSKIVLWVREMRAPFLAASVVPVAVGSAAAYAVTGTFDAVRFALALAGVVLLHAGANVANNYFDTRFGADSPAHPPTPFSGGSRTIEEGLLTPKQVLIGAWVLLAAGITLGVTLAVLCASWVVLALGVAGLLLGYFYTAPPVKLGYRGVGEIVVFFAFGILPVAGAFIVQAGAFEAWVLTPGTLVGLLIFEVLLANEFPDESADRSASKRTLVVLMGRKRAGWLYRGVLLLGYLLAGVFPLVIVEMHPAGAFYIMTLPVGALALHLSGPDLVYASGRHRANLVTLLLFITAGATLSAGFVYAGINGMCLAR